MLEFLATMTLFRLSQFSASTASDLGNSTSMLEYKVSRTWFNSFWLFGTFIWIFASHRFFFVQPKVQLNGLGVIARHQLKHTLDVSHSSCHGRFTQCMNNCVLFNLNTLAGKSFKFVCEHKYHLSSLFLFFLWFRLCTQSYTVRAPAQNSLCFRVYFGSYWWRLVAVFHQYLPF